MFLPFPIVGFILMFEEQACGLAVPSGHGNQCRARRRVETGCRRDGFFFYAMNHGPDRSETCGCGGTLEPGRFERRDIVVITWPPWHYPKPRRNRYRVRRIF
jgi:hypothetical protein